MGIHPPGWIGPMGLNIKNERVHDLARQASAVTGKTQTGAIEEALELLLRSYDADPDRVRTRRTIDAVHVLVADYAADPGVAHPEIVSVDDLFDSRSGLPR